MGKQQRNRNRQGSSRPAPITAKDLREYAEALVRDGKASRAVLGRGTLWTRNSR